MATRKSRGVRGSRQKLDAALAASQLNKKTQAALAEAIADAEGLDSIPKDLVSKLFRELPVDPQTIERAASVLGVSAQSLYQDAETTPANIPSPANKPANNKLPVYIATGIAVICLAVLLGYLLKQPASYDSSNCLSPNGGELSTPQNRLGIVIAQIQGDPHNEVQLKLARALASDPKLEEQIHVYTSCTSIGIANGDYRQQLAISHQQAQQLLLPYNAQLVIWGERYDNRLNLRFSHNKASDTPVQLKLAGKTINTTAVDFSFGHRLQGDQALPSDLTLISLRLMQPLSRTRQELSEQLQSRFQYSGHWLSEAVLSDAQLLRSISADTDPQLYRQTASQLCYRYRLLGDMQSSEQQYQLAHEACQQALSASHKIDAPLFQASILGNLATLNIRRYQFAQDATDRRARLEQGIEQFKQAKALYGHSGHPEEMATLYQNYAAAYIRLAEQGDDQAVSHLENAQELMTQSLKLSRAENNPRYYSQRLQNQCVLKNRLGAIKGKPALLSSSRQDCLQAQTFIDVQRYPQQWAMIQNNLAISYAIQAELESNPGLFQQALLAFKTAQGIYQKDKYPGNWAEVEINQAELSCKLALLQQNKELLQQSRHHAEAALLVFKQKGLKHYEQYGQNLLNKILSCQPTAFNQCGCSQ